MATGHLVLKPTTRHPKQTICEDISRLAIDPQKSNSSSQSSETSSNFGAVLQPKKERGKKKTKGRSSNFFSITDNKIEGIRAKRVGIFQFGNTHVHKGHQKEIQVDSSSGETDSASSEEEE
ncbi:unnamed protein product [Prunus brigantina]